MLIDGYGRRGLTLIEMVVSLALTGFVLAMVSAISLRQQRVVADLSEQNAVAARLREASAILPVQLRAARPTDLRDARDTALELRATIGSAVVCDTTTGALVLSPAISDPSYASFVAPPEAGDSAWVLANETNGEIWRGFAITATGSREPGPCAAIGPVLSTAERAASRLTVSGLASFAGLIGSPIRITRPMRYSIYRASDGSWYIGERDWNGAASRFNAIQPVAGPYVAPAAGGLRFRYADSLGAALESPVADLTAVASIDVELRSQTTNATRILGSAAAQGRRLDSTVLTIALRNRR